MSRFFCFKLVLCLFCFGSLFTSDTLAALNRRIAPQLGLVSAGASVSTDDSLESKGGYLLGVSVAQMIPGLFALQAELNFVQKGSKESTASSDLTVVNNLSYLDIPILVKFPIVDLNFVMLYLGVGPVISFLLSDSTETESSDGTTSTVTTTSSDDESDTTGRQSFDLSLSLGPSFQITVGSTEVYFDIRYVLGLTDVEPGVVRNYKNRTLVFLLGVGFEL